MSENDYKLDPDTYIMNMVCTNCEGHSVQAFKYGVQCKFKVRLKDGDTDPNLFFCPHCKCLATRATTRAGGSKYGN